MVWRNDQVSEGETELIVKTARECLKISGDFVELGCYKGDTSLLLADVLKGLDKRLWLYDSFEGLPEKSLKDESVLGKDFRFGDKKRSKGKILKSWAKSSNY